MKKAIALALAMLLGVFPCLAQHWFDGSARGGNGRTPPPAL